MSLASSQAKKIIDCSPEGTNGRRNQFRRGGKLRPCRRRDDCLRISRAVPSDTRLPRNCRAQEVEDYLQIAETAINAARGGDTGALKAAAQARSGDRAGRAVHVVTC